MKRILIIQHVDREGPGMFKVAAEEYGFNMDIVRRDLNQSINRNLKYDGIIIMGGPMGIEDINTEKYKWLKDEVRLIERVLKDGTRPWQLLIDHG